MVRTVLVDVLGEGAGQDRAVAAANAVEEGGAVVGLAARAVLMLADWPARGVLVQPYHGDVLTVLEQQRARTATPVRQRPRPQHATVTRSVQPCLPLWLSRSRDHAGVGR